MTKERKTKERKKKGRKKEKRKKERKKKSHVFYIVHHTGSRYHQFKK
jgi:hypothetical protein